MDWKELGQKIISLGAPLLGTALAGPAGGAVGALIANVFGSNADPEAIAVAIQQDPQALLKLKELQLKHAERLSEITLEHARIESQESMNALQQVNLTMRAESQSEHTLQWIWRPLWGIISAVTFLVVCIFVCVLAYRAITKADQTALTMIPLLVGAFTTLFGIPGAILGITAWGRNRLKESQAQAGNGRTS